MTFSIRQANATDAETLHTMIRELARFEGAEDHVKVRPADLAGQLGSPNVPFGCLLAEHGGMACGFALYFKAYSTWEGTPTLYLEDLYVNPAFRSAGVGASLISTLATIAKAEGCSRLEWSVLNWNVRAIDFYERLGARPVSGWTRYRMNAEELDAICK